MVKAFYGLGLWDASDWIRWACWKMAGSEEFDYTITAIVGVNTIMMASVHDGQPGWQTSALKILNYIFTGIYVFEAIVKIVGMRWRVYRSGWWNCFDFFIMIVSIIEMLPGMAVIPIGTILRPLRIGRIFKLLRSAKVNALQFPTPHGLRCLFNTLIQSLPAMYNVGSLLFLVCFVFAVLGMNLFGHVDGYEGGAIGDHANFWYFGRALLTVVRIVTGDSWSTLLADLTNCNDGKEGEPNWDCEVSPVPFMYFAALIGICSAVLLNLVVAIIVEKFVHNANDEGILTDDSEDSLSMYDILSKVAFLDSFIAALKRKIHAARLA
ncbi:mitochondrial thiamine pyrophosphate transporter [Cymbomonas tetramitiformis]|uniref:Mitochondrial thiamine pyrophosphate transporter n=1 Tax=Cymbomonas tetramitiformis TaxID=36881 RepID=A0AAE0GF46_9CHLO|nr:mitochondrial thiamine pyrophosphate transporter [Cymbomonas tetramitiformis]